MQTLLMLGDASPHHSCFSSYKDENALFRFTREQISLFILETDWIYRNKDELPD